MASWEVTGIEYVGSKNVGNRLLGEVQKFQLKISKNASAVLERAVFQRVIFPMGKIFPKSLPTVAKVRTKYRPLGRLYQRLS